MTIFNDDDTRELLRSLSPTQSHTNGLPRLVLTSDGHTLITREHLEDEFQRLLREGTERLPISALAKQLEVDEEIIVSLVEHSKNSPWRSIDKNNVIMQKERDYIEKEVTKKFQESLIVKPEISTFYDVDVKNIDDFIEGLDVTLCHFELDFICTQTYKDFVARHISHMLRIALQLAEPSTFVAENLPGHPPKWFVSQILDGVLELDEFSEDFYVRIGHDEFLCTPKTTVQDEHDDLFEAMRSGVRKLTTTQAVLEDFPELYSSIEDVERYAKTISWVEVIDEFIVSGTWYSKTVNECTQKLREDGHLDFSDWMAPKSIYHPDTLITTMKNQIVSKADEPSLFINEYILTEARLGVEKSKLCTYADADAIAQWQQFKQTPDIEVKFNINKIFDMIEYPGGVPRTIMSVKGTKKMLEDQFWATISKKEAENEVEFATFWNERITSRCHLYNEGLAAVEDQKLRDQLTELSVNFIQKELIPDAITKARSLGLVLSRKTRKNFEKLESKINSSATAKIDTLISTDMATLTTTLDRFRTKQGIELPTTSALEEAKTTMLQDMKRRMQKQRKSDGPVLFLTLVIILFANQHPGVIYATGKFAPKLLKQLKAHMPEDLYLKVEKWKEAAKTNTLSTEHREEMKKVVEA